MMQQEPLTYKVFGTTAQVLEVSIEPEQTLIADGGLLLYLDEEITHETLPDDGYVPEPVPIPEPEPEPIFEPEPEPIPEPEPEITPLPTRLSRRQDDDETDATFLEKLWKATRKTIVQIGQKIQESTKKKEEPAPEPEPAPSFAAVFAEPTPEPQPAPIPEPEPEPEPIFSWYLTHLHNPSEYIRKVGFTATHGGLVLPIVLDELQESAIIFQTGSFLCARKGVQLEKFLDTGISVNFTQGKLFKLDKVTGSGTIFLRGEGQLIEKEMENDAIRLNLFSLLAYESTLSLDTSKIELMDAMNYEDQTQFALLSGTGRYWLQTANLQHLIYRLSPVVFEPPTPEVQEVAVEKTPSPVMAEPTPEPPAQTATAEGNEEEPPLDIDKIVEEL